MKILLSLTLGSLGFIISTTSIYNHHFTTLASNEISLASYQGKKMLLVNIASASPLAATQINQLQRLYNEHQNNLVIIAFPTSDFGNEPRSNSELKLLMANTYHTTFPVSVRIGVKDSLSNTHSLYKWLQNKSENGMADGKVNMAFQKFLINNDGTLIGVYSDKTSPLDSSILRAIGQ